ncbi:hypothetical protein ABB37_01186 [Leptomonas pyrrhocoris]|uniref:Uncharacterized protein n=1 Tax=Leptomonas pyrrhocoris TaxID=157538 RepID=A0A0M9G8I1_LEPPY|nr:hypothetical protein ABB37_01186 [Leptomonas pyrrhocoris]KPA84676.1 hypothetical protein ABB37_01186 [Leptomonas pyrrhocoris]|eukprot:XP_015663115.1 hypothetical protein ABB37_01186 [Leptomonas pyrrhocoris]
MHAMRFWHRRLLAHPIYERCVRFVHLRCPTTPPTDSAEAAHAWMASCDRWWNALSAFVSHTSSPYTLPADKTWNPYSFSKPVVYTRSPPVRRENAGERVALAVSSAKRSLPPPLSYHMVIAEYRLIASEADALRSYVVCLTMWWRRACQWAAVSNREYAWISPPPTTGANAADWAALCELWRRSTVALLREEEYRTKAAELEALTAAFKLQQRIELSFTSIDTTPPSQLNQLLH